MDRHKTMAVAGLLMTVMQTSTNSSDPGVHRNNATSAAIPMIDMMKQENGDDVGESEDIQRRGRSAESRAHR